MLHRGEIVEKAVRQNGISITNLARRLGKSRRHIYNMFDNPQLSIDTVLEIGRIIHYDFAEITHIKDQGTENPEHHALDDAMEYENAAYWKDKYIKLLEKYNALLEKGEEGKK